MSGMVVKELDECTAPTLVAFKHCRWFSTFFPHSAVLGDTTQFLLSLGFIKIMVVQKLYFEKAPQLSMMDF